MSENAPGTPSGKKRKTISHETVTWKLFEKYFLELDPSAYPLLLGPYTKGQALSLSIGMNTCHVQHMRETGMPEGNMLYSAKPRAISEGEPYPAQPALAGGALAEEDPAGSPPSPSHWMVEISTNYTRTGKTRPSRTRKGLSPSWMENLLGREEQGSSPFHLPSSPSPSSPSTHPGLPPSAGVPPSSSSDTQEDLINQLYGKD